MPRQARPDVVAAGLGIPATIDFDRGVAIHAVNLTITDVPIRDLMEERLGLPVYVDNDATVAALAEHLYGAGRGAQNVVMLTIGTGIGGGLILNGEIYRGSTGAGAELGHIVIEENGPPCQGNCPNHGCVEALASGTAIAKAGMEAAGRDPDSALGKALAEGPIEGRTVTELALAGRRTGARGRRAGRPPHRRGAEQPGQHLRSGRLRDRWGCLGRRGPAARTPPARSSALGRCRPQNERPVKLAELGPDAGMIGAAAMALIELDKER